jgi:hypothetical protein
MLFCQDCGAASPDKSRSCCQCGRSFRMPSKAASDRKPYRSAYVRWAILAIVFSMLVVGVVKALPVLAFGSPSSSTSSASSNFSSFVGTWYGHSRSLNFASNGHAHYTARAYRWCGPGISLPCDSWQGNIIVDGINEQMVFKGASGPTAYGTIVSSTAGDTGQSVTLTVQPHDTLLLSFTSKIPVWGDQILVCGPHAPVGSCGA